MWLFLALTLVPLIEIGLFIQVGSLIGLWPTLGLVLAMAFFGTWLLRTQGAIAFSDLRRSMTEFRDPAGPVAHGALILFAGLLLLTPGFFTDLVGLALLIRPVRSLVIAWAAARVNIAVVRPAMDPRTRRDADDDVIDAEYRDLGTRSPRVRTRH
jgi:UPF0716 protein FxsA